MIKRDVALTKTLFFLFGLGIMGWVPRFPEVGLIDVIVGTFGLGPPNTISVTNKNGIINTKNFNVFIFSIVL